MDDVISVQDNTMVCKDNICIKRIYDVLSLDSIINIYKFCDIVT